MNSGHFFSKLNLQKSRLTLPSVLWIPCWKCLPRPGRVFITVGTPRCGVRCLSEGPDNAIRSATEGFSMKQKP